MAVVEDAVGLPRPVRALPVAALCWIRVDWQPFRRELWSRIKLALVLALALVLVAVLSGRQIASTLRNHRELGHLANPVAVLSRRCPTRAPPARHGRRGRRAARPRCAPRRRHGRGRQAGGVRAGAGRIRARGQLLAGRLCARDTNPELSRLPIDYFRNVHSCGTDTAVSVPCMFSNLGRGDYKESGAAASENVLDILSHAGYRVTWYDNNTGSRDVAKRLDERDEYDSQDPRFCGKAGCYDEILVDNLRGELGAKADDRVIVLHTKGSHGPAYYQRYPEAFARFQPACATNELQMCSRQQIINAYDNTILYADHIVASAIRALQADGAVDSALLYISDHGESTGEGGLYLHGAPYLIAPESQTHIPMLLWLSDGFRRGAAGQGLHRRRGAAVAGQPVRQPARPARRAHGGVSPALDAFAGCATGGTRPAPAQATH